MDIWEYFTSVLPWYGQLCFWLSRSQEKGEEWLQQSYRWSPQRTSHRGDMLDINVLFQEIHLTQFHDWEGLPIIASVRKSKWKNVTTGCLILQLFTTPPSPAPPVAPKPDLNNVRIHHHMLEVLLGGSSLDQNSHSFVTSSCWCVKASTIIQKASRVLHICFHWVTSASSFKLYKNCKV